MERAELPLELQAFSLPSDRLSLEDVKRLQQLLDLSTRRGVESTKVVLPQATAVQLFARLEAALKAAPTLVEV